MKQKSFWNRIGFLLLALLILISVPVAASAAETTGTCEPLEGQNINAHNYGSYASPVYSYLTVSGKEYMRVQGNVSGQNGIIACYYDSDFTPLR